MQYLGTNLRAHLVDRVKDDDLRGLLYEIAACARYINLAIKDAQRGFAGSTNAYGEQQLALDVLADTILKDRFRQTRLVREFASEEGEDIVTYAHLEGRFSVTVDPLDGSSLVDTNLSIGTIIGIHDTTDITQPQTLVAAMYVLYGPLTTMVYAAQDSGVHEFVLNPAGEYIVSRNDIRLRERGTIYAPGGTEKDWTPGHAAFIQYLREEGYKLRYSGGMVGDLNQILAKGGGIFCYPGTTKDPEGKLRLLFENQPMAYIFEQAGGKASTGCQRILELPLNTVDQRSPIYIGSRYEVEAAQTYLRERSAEGSSA